IPAAPVPVRLTTCGLSRALSVKVRFPVLVPTVVGEKMQVIEQIPFVGVTGLLTWSVAKKSPLATMLEMVSLACPVLVSFTVCGEIGRASCRERVLNVVGARLAKEKTLLTVRPSDSGLKLGL